ncbi:MAG TPA: sigma 54-interacting transcriptional regulator [Negativicutes bacterium]|nr:sigma 54-interacting transcriptional regulator [Negativicutes bacterium]
MSLPQTDDALQKLFMLQTAFENLPNPLIIVNRAGVIVFCNKAYANLLSLDQHRILGEHVTKVIPNTKLLKVMETQRDDEISHHKFPNGKTTIGRRVPIFDDGQVIGCIGFIQFEDSQALQIMAKRFYWLEDQVTMYKEIIENRAIPAYTFDSILSVSAKMEQCKQISLKVAQLDLPVLVTGENGVGKELLVHAIHDASDRRLGPLIKVNCTSIPKDLFEAEFFGYVKGAFSGAKREGKKGFFELADQGTIFLDEIGDVSLEAQSKLLRVIQDKEFYKVGGEHIIRCNVRIVAATNRNLHKMVDAGEFREDLFYRLNSISLEVPPLRERKEDISLLADYFLTQFGKEYRIAPKRLSLEAFDLLHSYHWPGNIRELRNVLTKLSVFCSGDTIEPEDVAAVIQVSEVMPPAAKEQPLKEYLKKREKDYLLQVLRSCQGNKSLTAKKLGIDRSLLYKKLRALGS